MESGSPKQTSIALLLHWAYVLLMKWRRFWALLVCLKRIKMENGSWWWKWKNGLRVCWRNGFRHQILLIINSRIIVFNYVVIILESLVAQMRIHLWRNDIMKDIRKYFNQETNIWMSELYEKKGFVYRPNCGQKHLFSYLLLMGSVW